MRIRSLLAAALLATACGETTYSPGSPGAALVAFEIRGAAYIRTVVVEVSGPGIDSPVVLNIDVDTAGAGTGTAQIPAGAGRQFTALAFDIAGVNTHRGDTTVTLVAGANPSVGLVLTPLTGTLPITLTFGGVGLTITPGDTTLAVGDTARYVAGGVDSLGSAIPSASVTWSSTDQLIALVNTQGRVQARSAGIAHVLATYQGATVGRKVTVVP